MFQSFLTILLLFVISAVNAENVIFLNSGKEEIFLNKDRVKVLEDPTGKLPFEEVRNSNDFVSPELEYPANHNTESTYWIKFTVNLEEGQEKNWLLECYTFKINNLQFFFPDASGNYIKSETGDEIPFYARTFSHKNFEFNIPKNPGSNICFIKFKTRDPILFVSVLRSYNRFTAYSLSEYFMLGLFYGIILVIAFYNFFLYLNIRENAYLFYVLYVLSVGFYSMSQDGTGFQYLWPDYPSFNRFASSFFLFGLVCWLLMYTRSFLNIKLQIPWLDKIFLIYIAGRFILFILSLSLFPDLRSILRVDVFPFILCYIGSIILLLRGASQARYFVAGFTMLLVSFLLNGLMFAKLLPSNIFTVYAINLGVVGEMILLSLAMADRVREIRESKVRSERESRVLEEMVKERTAALRDANLKLKNQADEIHAMNKMLFADNRKLQENVKSMSESRVLQQDLSFEEFNRIYPDDKSCYKFIADIKWENGYMCSKCRNTSSASGKSAYSKRCTKCGYDESPTAFTLFHAVKIPIRKALYMTFLVIQNDALSADKLAEKLELTVKTCWNFRKRVLEATSTGKRKTKDWKTVIMAPKKKET